MTDRHGLTPSQTADIDQAIAESQETIDALVLVYHDKVKDLGSREVAIIGLTAYLVNSDDFEPRMIAQYLALAIDRLDQLTSNE